MFKACFVARFEPAEKTIDLFCQFRNQELGTTTDLPHSQKLGQFCFPLGPEQVKPKEYSAPEVRICAHVRCSTGRVAVCIPDQSPQNHLQSSLMAESFCRSTRLL